MSSNVTDPAVTDSTNTTTTDTTTVTSPNNKGKGKAAATEEPMHVEEEEEEDDDDDDDDDDAEEEEDDEVEETFEEIDPSAIVPSGRRTRGVRVDYTSAEALAKAGLKAEDLEKDEDGDIEMH
ncbi:hypothetical protein P691DRAFT_777021 [Macrolepiota fuliginosa MF-IS2]|uniref:Histone chaperone domain-containing protein n=1 Tax=Macrolepiota fuliginosa MF-IS2 TaxID=1400762 RepID=A0A9P6C267_9AGAR|nr:hypothetical protein P691DRAFT_777021 [Macrolepiota fuliginosa MF-IS2]